ncbi:MAG: DUF2807 domain-containing protein [Bacteroidales bacterium]|nr:DUF2807 domain-containing protein [Bacteroidales bacterium]
MKRLTILAAAAIMFSSCFHVNTGFNFGGQGTVKGEGPVTCKSYELSGFDSVLINGHADVNFVQADAFEVTVCSQPNIFEHLDVYMDGSTLVFKTKKNVRAEELDLTLRAPVLKKVEVNGAADFDIPAGLVTDGDFSIEVNGAGDLDLKGIRCAALSIGVNGAADIETERIDVQTLSVQVNGAGDVTLDGKTVDASLEVNGAGDIDARALTISGELNRRSSGLAKIRR